MNTASGYLLGFALSSLLLGGCTSQITQTREYSGYLSTYNNLQPVTTNSGQTAMRWVSPSWNPNAYDTVVFNRLELYPMPRPNERVNRQTFQQLQDEMTDNARGVLGQKYQLVPTTQYARPGAKVLILRAAITGVNASNQGMRWYEVIPVAAVIGGVSSITGHRDQDTELYIEAEFIDAANHQTVARVVRKVFGRTLDNASQPVTSDDFKRAIGALTRDLQAFTSNAPGY